MRNNDNCERNTLSQENIRKPGENYIMNSEKNDIKPRLVGNTAKSTIAISNFVNNYIIKNICHQS